MTWKKLGCIYHPENQFDWMVSHASNPIALALDGSVHRIFFGCRGSNQQTSVGYIDVDLHQPSQILNLSKVPALTPGQPGFFDDSGTSVGCLVQRENRLFLYYVGWNLAKTVPFRNSIGLAICHDGEPSSFTKISNVPIMDRDKTDPLSLSYPWVLYENGRWRMWYGSHLSWNDGTFEMVHGIKYAESEDGLAWKRQGQLSIHFDKDRGEYAFSRPCVVKENGIYKMWYSYRGCSYRIGYAESGDGLRWERRDERAGIATSLTGWDSQSVEYASVFSFDQSLFMLYNGNDYGKSGFGLAIWE